MNLIDNLKDSLSFLKGKINEEPEIGLILGSGLGLLADEIENPVVVPYEHIPHFPVSTVEGHKGQLVFGTLEGKKVVAMQGRFHFYEGYSMEKVVYPVRVMKALNVKKVILTNACGAFNPELYPGALMLINDHINFQGTNPLIGKNHKELGPRFPDMSQTYSPRLISIGKKVAANLEIEVFEGVYTAVSGPYYFSKAELRMVRSFGSDTIGMSTVPEAIVAVHSGMEVMGISCITDMAIPESLEHLEHEQVIEIANKARPKFIQLVKGILSEI